MDELMPCPWPVQECGPLPDPGSQEYSDLNAVSSEVLWALSGRQFGCCRMPEVRPCKRTCPDWRGQPWPNPQLLSGSWVNVVCGRCAPFACACFEVEQIWLEGPVCGIVEIRVDGEVVPTGGVRVDDGNWLVRTDGGTWPTCQAMDLPTTEPGTFGIVYERGVPVPPGGQRANGELMSELWKACTGDKTCCLPKRVQTVTRQGISMQMIAPLDFLKEGKTGLYFTDIWLQSVNPEYRPQRARVISPDWEPPRSTTWP